MQQKDRFYNFGFLFTNSMMDYGNSSVLEWKKENKYLSLTGYELLKKVYLVTKALEGFAYPHGVTAGIISENRWEWAVSDFSCIFNQIATVPIYTTMTASQIKYILNHCEAKIVFISNSSQLDKILEIKSELPSLEKTIIFSGEGTHNIDKVISFSDLIKDDTQITNESMLFYLNEKASKILPEELLTIIYTSGTTGIPKGVCLSNKNILSDLAAILNSFQIDKNDTFLSYLPLAHSYERTTGYYLPLITNAKITYAVSLDTIAVQLQEVKPTILVSVPLLFTRIRNRLIKSMEKMSYIQRIIFKFALWTANNFKRNMVNPFVFLSDTLVYKKIRNRMGGRIRFFVSGGAALNKDAGKMFNAFGINLLEGYGLTETSPVISVNRENKNKLGTVGIPLNGVNVKLAEDGEILVKGDIVMMGYYKNEEETNKMIKNGWLHTGDIGEFDEDGFLKITDRKKSLIKTAGGKYISLTHIEDALSRSKYISQVLVSCSDKMFVTALIVPNMEELKDTADAMNIKYNTHDELIYNDEIKKIIDKSINEEQAQLPKYEKVRKYKLLTKPFTIESGEITPTLKLKRKVIEEKHKDILDELYTISNR